MSRTIDHTRNPSCAHDGNEPTAEWLGHEDRVNPLPVDSDMHAGARDAQVEPAAADWIAV